MLKIYQGILLISALLLLMVSFLTREHLSINFEYFQANDEYIESLDFENEEFSSLESRVEYEDFLISLLSSLNNSNYENFEDTIAFYQSLIKFMISLAMLQLIVLFISITIFIKKIKDK